MEASYSRASIGRTVLAAATAMHEFFETMLSVPDASPRDLAWDLARKHDLGFAERSHLRKIAERTDLAKDIARALEERFGIQVHDESLLGRTISDHEGFTDYVFGRGGKSTRRVFSHHIMFGVERERWYSRERQYLGYVESMGAFQANPLRWDVADKIKADKRVRLRPLVYKAKGRHLLSSNVGMSPESKLLAALCERQMDELRDEHCLFCETMRHEIRHVIDHLMAEEGLLVGKTVETQSHLYEQGCTPMRGFERDLKAIEKRLETVKHLSSSSVSLSEQLGEQIESRHNQLKEAATLFESLTHNHRDRINNEVFSYVFSLVKIEHLPLVLTSIAGELAG